MPFSKLALIRDQGDAVLKHTNELILLAMVVKQGREDAGSQAQQIAAVICQAEQITQGLLCAPSYSGSKVFRIEGFGASLRRIGGNDSNRFIQRDRSIQSDLFETL